MLYHGPVRVPADARPGKAKFVCELSKKSALTSLPTEVEVVLVAAKTDNKQP
jgi:hypothetical protein